MASVAGPDERIEQARRRWLDASAAANRAREELAHLEIEAATMRAKAEIETALEQGCSPELHGELVAHAARYHGATCARASSISDVSWRGVRVAIESIVKRVKTAEDARDGYVIELECARERARIATHAVIDAIGSVGPESVEQAVPRLVAVMREARERAVRAEAVLTRGGAAIVDEPAERSLYDARAALRDLVAALALDDGPRIEAIRRARATLERWGMR